MIALLVMLKIADKWYMVLILEIPIISYFCMVYVYMKILFCHALQGIGI